MSEEQVSVRKSVAWSLVVFGGVLALVIGVRLEEAALAAIVGVACGVGASIPTSYLMVSWLRRRDTRQRERAYPAAQPPVVVVTPPTAPQLPQRAQEAMWAGAYPTSPPVRREFAVIGEEEADDEFDYWSS